MQDFVRDINSQLTFLLELNLNYTLTRNCSFYWVIIYPQSGISKLKKNTHLTTQFLKISTQIKKNMSPTNFCVAAEIYF